MPNEGLSDLDYVLALNDPSSARSDSAPTQPVIFAASGKPAIVSLAALLRATDDQDRNRGGPALSARSRLSSRRGAAQRPSLTDGQLAIAKFPKPDDIRDIAAGEILALTLARQAGITVADHRLVGIGDKSVSVITRFDRRGAASFRPRAHPPRRRANRARIR